MEDLNRPEELIRRMQELMEESRRLKQRHDELIEQHAKLRRQFEKAIRNRSATQASDRIPSIPICDLRFAFPQKESVVVALLGSRWSARGSAF